MSIGDLVRFHAKENYHQPAGSKQPPTKSLFPQDARRLKLLPPVECPTGSGKMMALGTAAGEISRRLMRIFLRDPSTGSGQVGRRAVFGGTEKFQTDPY
jgi:hypothetical protein